MASDISQSSLNLSSEEKRAFGQLFQQADTDRLGVVPGDVAVKFFERTKLESGLLAQIWQIADTENRGLLTPAGFSVALRLIGHAQAGREPTAELALKPGPMPRFDNDALAISAPSTPIQAAQTGPIRVPPLTPDRVAEFASMFEKGGARGDGAKQIFEKARLPNETLGRIWTLADGEQRGALNLTEFIIAMHLITSMKNGSLRAVPQTLPAGLYDAASRRAPQPPAPRIPGQYNQPQRTASPLSRPVFPAPATSNASTNWLVTPQDKIRFDQLFSTIDKTGTGYINGEQAVSFFSTSGLSEDVLANIWDLADINSEGQLSRDEFAVAMYLIRQQRGKRENRDILPTTLPPQLIPPSMRQTALPPSQTTAPTFDNAANAPIQSKAVTEDLFGLDALEPSKSPVPSSPARTVEAPIFKPFVPSSSFGVGLAQQSTGSTTRGQSGLDELLAVPGPDLSKQLAEQNTALSSMSDQLGTLRTQMSEVQQKKTATETELATATNQKRELESRLAQFRAQYEQEIRDVKSLEEKLTSIRNDTRKVQQEMAMVEGALQDLQNRNKQAFATLESEQNLQKEAAAGLEAAQKENAALKERNAEVNAEIASLKTQLEQHKANARQQKGLVAINKKQLAASEIEKDELQQEIHAEEQQRETSVSPAASVSSQNTNPFFRGTGTSIMSPSIFTQDVPSNSNAFDSFFGPTAATTQPPPATSFRPATPQSESAEAQITPASTPRGIEPPAPPESRQITSSALPLRLTSFRTDSFSSSVKANPSLSRAESSGAATPVALSGTPTGSTEGTEPAVSTEVPGAFPGDPASPLTEKPRAQEFPPIQQLEPEESDSDEERGFEDDFAPNSTIPAAADVASDASTLPTPTRQLSPPTYDQAVPPPNPDDRESNQFPKEYTGLLPSREITHSPPEEVPQLPPKDLVHTLPVNGSVQHTPVEHTRPQADDFDSAFDDLSEAKIDDPAQRQLGLGGKDDYDFDPVFDSPAPSKVVHDGPYVPHASNPFPAGGATQAFYGKSEQPQPAGDHDWDELFSSLDSSAPNGKDPFEVAPATAGATTSSFDNETFAPPPGPPPGRAVESSAARPQTLQRAITTEHDDPILKSLTNMGYERTAALKALEKFDYNLDMAADYLTSRT